MRYPDRRAAGRILAGQLQHYANRPDVIVLALPRGGVPVGFEVAQALGAPLEIFMVRKLGVPGREELAMGAIASGGVRVLNATVVEQLHLASSVIDAVALREAEELRRRELLYGEKAADFDLTNRVAILVDDGLATGSTMRAAIAAVRQHRAARIVIAVQVAAADTLAALEKEVEEIVCPLAPAYFQAVGEWYEQFDQTTDDEVRELLAQAGRG